MPDTPRPWWWLTSADCLALGIGEGARRTDKGVVFGAGTSTHRLEVVPRSEDAPVKLGSVALRLWGPTAHPGAKRVLVLGARMLHARRDEGFDAAAIPGDLDGPRAAVSSAPSAPTVIIDLPSVCERACVFCGIAAIPRAARRPRGSDDEVAQAIDAAQGPVLFTGDDALASPRVVAWVQRASRRGLPVALIGPPRRGATAALAPQLAQAGLGRYLTAIFGEGPAAHDAVAGLDGAFTALEEAVVAMRAAGVRVELVTPLIAPLLPALPGILGRAHALIGATPTLLAYAPDTPVGTTLDHVVPRFDTLREALAPLFAPGGPRPSIDALPLCVLPEALRAGAAARLSRSDQKLGACYPEEACGGCALRAGCPGVATTVLRAVGATGLVTLRTKLS